MHFSDVHGVQVGDHNDQRNTFVIVHPPQRRHTVEPFPAEPAPPSDWLRAQPSRLLDARHEVVPFDGRSAELRRLTEWRDADDRESYLLIHAAGGQGKTRLAARFARASRAGGWWAGSARLDPGSAAGGLSGEDRRGTLIVVDYADRWPHHALLGLLREARSDPDGPVRVLLLGRSVRWWAAVRAELAETSTAPVDDLALPALGADGPSRRAIFAAALQRFGAADLYDQDPGAIPVPDAVSGDAFSTALTLHMAALAAVDAHSRGRRPPDNPHELSAYLLDREYLAWQRAYSEGPADRGHRTSPAVMAQVVFTASLTAPMTHPDGERLLRRLNLAGHPHDILADHRGCYPPADPATVLEPLAPDRLAEDFLALLIPGHTVTGYEPDPWASHAPALVLRRRRQEAATWTSHALITLAAAADRWPHVREGCLGPLLLDDPKLAVDAGSAALTALAAIGEDDASWRAVLEKVVEKLPQESDVDLDLGKAAISRTLIPHRMAATADPLKRAELYYRLANHLVYAGERQEALSNLDHAIELLTSEAGSADPASLVILGQALATRGDRLCAGGEHDRGFRDIRAGCDILVRLVKSDQRYSGLYPTIIELFRMLATRMAEQGEHVGAIDITRRTIVLCRGVVATGEQKDANLLARMTATLARLLEKSGRPDEACAPCAEAVGHYRDLVATAPGRHLPELVQALSIWARLLTKREDYPQALSVSAEAVASARRLAETNPAAFASDLLGALTSRAVLLARCGRQPEAIAPMTEAKELAETIADVDPSKVQDLVEATANLGMLQGELGRHAESLTTLRRSATRLRELARSLPTTYRTAFARGLWALAWAGLQAGGAHLDAAAAAADEALTLYDELAAAEPGVYSGDRRDLVKLQTTIAAARVEAAFARLAGFNDQIVADLVANTDALTALRRRLEGDVCGEP